MTVQYDDGEPMDYAAVEIKSPDAKVPFQSGWTDRNGCFMFKPDEPGLWHAVVTDGMGHQENLEIKIGGAADGPETAPAHPSAPPSGDPSRSLRIFAGLSLITGIFGFLFGWKARRAGAPRS